MQWIMVPSHQCAELYTTSSMAGLVQELKDLAELKKDGFLSDEGDCA